MSQFLLSPAARSDIIEIWTYYAVEVGDLDLADRVKEDLFTAMRKVALNPGLVTCAAIFLHSR